MRLPNAITYVHECLPGAAVSNFYDGINGLHTHTIVHWLEAERPSLCYACKVIVTLTSAATLFCVYTHMHVC